MVYGLIVLESGILAANEIFHLVAVTIVLSILLHSSTDVVVARAFDEQAEVPAGTASCAAPYARCADNPVAHRPTTVASNPIRRVAMTPVGERDGMDNLV